MRKFIIFMLIVLLTPLAASAAPPETGFIWREDSFKTSVYSTAEQAEPDPHAWLLIGCPVDVLSEDQGHTEIRILDRTVWVDSCCVVEALPEGRDAPTVLLETYLDITASVDDTDTFVVPAWSHPQLLGYLGGGCIIRYEDAMGHLGFPVSYSVSGDALAPWLPGWDTLDTLCVPILVSEYGLTQEETEAAVRSIVYWNVIPGPVMMSVHYVTSEENDYVFLFDGESETLFVHTHDDGPGLG